MANSGRATTVMVRTFWDDFGPMIVGIGGFSLLYIMYSYLAAIPIFLIGGMVGFLFGVTGTCVFLARVALNYIDNITDNAADAFRVHGKKILDDLKGGGLVSSSIASIATNYLVGKLHRRDKPVLGPEPSDPLPTAPGSYASSAPVNVFHVDGTGKPTPPKEQERQENRSGATEVKKEQPSDEWLRKDRIQISRRIEERSATGDYLEVKALLQHQEFNPSIVIDLTKAAEKNNQHSIGLILQARVDPNLTISTLVNKGNSHVLENFMKNESLVRSKVNISKHISTAITLGYADIVKVLAKYRDSGQPGSGIPVDTKGEDTPGVTKWVRNDYFEEILEAAHLGDSIRVERLLHRPGFDPLAFSQYKNYVGQDYTNLAKLGCFSSLGFLVEKGVDLNPVFSRLVNENDLVSIQKLMKNVRCEGVNIPRHLTHAASLGHLDIVRHLGPFLPNGDDGSCSIAVGNTTALSGVCC